MGVRAKFLSLRVSSDGLTKVANGRLVLTGDWAMSRRAFALVAHESEYSGIIGPVVAYDVPMDRRFETVRPTSFARLPQLVVGLSGLLLWTLGGVGCDSVRSPSPPDVKAPVHLAEAAAAPVASTPPTRDAGVELVDLLHTIECTVAVSSKVDNPKDFPEHLVDGKADTAWNGKTGDLHGFIAFRTPNVARVRRVELTVGFDKAGPKGDLFTKNHRITRVRLSRMGALVKEVDLDPEVRGLQGIDLDEAGGDFKLEVLATKPGTEKKWQELVVSELRVLGSPNGAPEKPEHIPAMAIGSLDGVPHRKARRGEPPPGPFASIRELCTAYDQSMAPLIDAAFPGDRYPGKIGGPHCAPLVDASAQKAAAALVGGPFVAAELVRVNDTSQESARVVMKSEKGYSLTSVALWSRYHDDPGCGHAGSSSLEGAKAIQVGVHNALIVRVLRTDVYWLGSTDPGGTYEYAYACKLDDRGGALCEGPVLAGWAAGWPAGWDVAAGTFPPVVRSKVKWDSQKEPTLGPAGDLRLLP